MEIELDEERSSVELLNDRITRTRDQVRFKVIWINMQISDCISRSSERFPFIASLFFSSVHPALFSQVDQLRSELMQERSARHDLEMDKSALERQVFACTHKFTHTHTRTHTVCLSHCVTLFAAEGAEVSPCRHGGSVSTLSWNHSAGKQSSRAGGETTQWRKVCLSTHNRSNKRVLLFGVVYGVLMVQTDIK